MPIKPENKTRYPKNWKEISKDIRTNRAKNKCEVCGVNNYAVGVRNDKGKLCSIGGNVMYDLAASGQSYPSLEPLTYKEAKEILDGYNEIRIDDMPKAVMIILTVAHLDHTPENCDYANLKAMCQKCHNNYDRQHRNETIKNGRKDPNQTDLFNS